MDTLLQDIRFGWRLLRRTPGFTISAVPRAGARHRRDDRESSACSNRVVLRPLPYPDPDRLAMVWEANDWEGAAARAHLTGSTSSTIARAVAGCSRTRPLVVSPADAHRNRPRSPARQRDRDDPQPLRRARRAAGARPRLSDAAGLRRAHRGDQPPALARALRQRIRRSSARPSRSTGRCSRSPASMPARLSISGRPPTSGPHDVGRGPAQPRRALHGVARPPQAGITVDAANNELRALTRRLGQENPSTNGEYTARAVPLATEVVGFLPARRSSRCSARRRSCW